jgi:hypothetical protein
LLEGHCTFQGHRDRRTDKEAGREEEVAVAACRNVGVDYPSCAWQEKAQDFGVVTFEEDTTLPTETPFGKKTKSPHK